MASATPIQPISMSRGQVEGANVYFAHSHRLDREVTLIGAASYEYWLLLEWDPNIAWFCERPNLSWKSSGQRLPDIDFWVKPRTGPAFAVALTTPEYLALSREDRLAAERVFSDELVTPIKWVTEDELSNRVIGIRNRKMLIHLVDESVLLPRAEN